MAATLGQPNVDRMLRGMTFTQFIEWRAYAGLEPFDETRADQRTGSIVQALYNLFARKKHQRAYALNDFVLRFGEAADRRAPLVRTHTQTWEQQKAMARVLARAYATNVP